MNAIASAAIVAFLIGLYSGYEWRDMVAQVDEATAIKHALKKQKESDDISRAEEITLIKSQQKTQIVYRSINKEAPKYVSKIQKSDSACNVSFGVVRLFNRAVSERMPEANTGNVAGDKKPSSVTESRLINYSLNNITEYNRVKNQCNALIAWHKKINNLNSNDGN